MSGETNLDVLLSSMSATLIDGIYVFVTLKDGSLPTSVTPRMMFQESEGTTYIILQSDAQTHNIAAEFPSRMITLNIHSALEAVGFMARIATELAKHNMGVNPVSAFYHDHLFVPADRAKDAMDVLAGFSKP